jgi:hypothetical protein
VVAILFKGPVAMVIQFSIIFSFQWFRKKIRGERRSMLSKQIISELKVGFSLRKTWLRQKHYTLWPAYWSSLWHEILAFFFTIGRI